MDKISEKLTVYFDAPYWAGVFEQISEGKLSVCKVTFKTEPKDFEILDFILKHYNYLKFGPPVKTTLKQIADNPKRRQRNIKKQLQSSCISTKSQQALQLQREEIRNTRKKVSREQREAEKQHQFYLKQQSRKQKHKGH